MLICCECNRIFEEPKLYKETHGLDYGPFEEYYGCPVCGGAYAGLLECDCCGRHIIGDYFATKDGNRYCDDCVTHRELGDED